MARALANGELESMPREAGVREILNELRWHPRRDPSRARIYYEHRSVDEGFAVVTGDEVEEVGASSFTVRGSTIPFYKVFRITYDDQVLLERTPGSRGVRR